MRTKIFKLPEKREFSNPPQLLGFNKLIDERIAYKRKWVWFLITFFCICFFTWQSFMCIYKYFQYPTSISFYNLENKPAYFPSLTICNNNHRVLETLTFIENSTKKFSEQHLKEISTTYGFQENSTTVFISCELFYQENKSEECDESITYENYTNIETLSTVLGQCVDFTLKYPVVKRGFGFGLFITGHIPTYENRSSQYQFYNIYFHEKKVIYPHKIFRNIHIDDNSTSLVQFVFQNKMTKYQNTPNTPCISVPDSMNCWANCVQKIIDKEISCKLPHMNLSIHSTCETWKEVLATFKVVRNLHSSGSIDSCPCIRPCEVTEHSLKNFHTLMRTADGNVMLNFEFFQGSDLLEKEIYAYPFSSLASDLSGIIGFSLGLSLYNLAELFEFVIVRVKTYWFAKCKINTVKIKV